MRTLQLKSLFIGFGAACLLGVAAVAALFSLAGPDVRPISHDVALPSGKVLKVTASHFAWGVEHAERFVDQDSFALEYASTVPHTDLAAVDRETVEAFELIRPISEQWGLSIASVAAFPSVQRRGKYFAYAFKRQPNGKWTFERTQRKVFAND